MFIHDLTIRRKLWLPKGIRSVVTVTGSHQRTSVFVTLTLKGRQLFRQCNKFNQYTFLYYLKQIMKRLGKVILFTDRARQHQSKRGTRIFDRCPPGSSKNILFTKRFP